MFNFVTMSRRMEALVAQRSFSQHSLWYEIYSCPWNWKGGVPIEKGITMTTGITWE